MVTGPEKLCPSRASSATRPWAMGGCRTARLVLERRVEGELRPTAGSRTLRAECRPLSRGPRLDHNSTRWEYDGRLHDEGQTPDEKSSPPRSLDRTWRSREEGRTAVERRSPGREAPHQDLEGALPRVSREDELNLLLFAAG